MISKTSLINLQQKLKNQDFILAKDAAQQLNCAPTWLNEYWCKSGFLTIENLVYWKLVRQEEVDEVLKLKEAYMKGAEASKLLGMPHSHITNLVFSKDQMYYELKHRDTWETLFNYSLSVYEYFNAHLQPTEDILMHSLYSKL